MAWLFAIAVFWAAALLFAVQPMVAKMLLPTLGGSPAVWIASMVFFQSALLAGYALAHAVRLTRPRYEVALYAGLLALGALVLPVALAPWAPPASGAEAWWVVGALAWMVGPAFVALAPAGPLLQHWFARAARRGAGAPEPYALFAASNAGSLVGLLAYPFLIEPNLTLSAQARVWAIAYGLFALLALIAGVASLRRGRSGGLAPSPTPKPAAPLSRRDAGRWLLWSFAGSSLLLGTTLHLTTDVASVPLLWVLPLVVYLLTFVFAFRPGLRAGWRAPKAGRVYAAMVAVLAIVVLKEARDPPWLVYAIHLAVLGFGAYVCHARLSSARPDPSRLTAYYLVIAAGGALGGVFNALLAPVLFDWVAEYPIAVALACGAIGRTGALADRPPPSLAGRLSALMTAGGLLALWVAFVRTSVLHMTGSLAIPAYTIDVLAIGIPALALYGLQRDGWILGGGFLGIALVMGLGGPWPAAANRPTERVVYQERTFFGVTTVRALPSDTGHRLVHGVTEHGAEITRSGLAGKPTSYYHPFGPAGDIMQTLDHYRADERGARVALIGLGAGSLLAYGEPGDRFTVYEIDPLVIEIARDPRWFSFAPSAEERGVAIEWRLGDGRLGLARTGEAMDAVGGEDAGYDLIVLDAFSSDAIPPHLLTIEAFGTYGRALAPGGMILVHISNRYLDLEPVVLASAARLGWGAWARAQTFLPGHLAGEGIKASQWVLLTPASDPAGGRPDPDAILRALNTWDRLDPAPFAERVWTDDYSDLLSAIRRGE